MYQLKALEESTGKPKVLWIADSLQEAKDAANAINAVKPQDSGALRFQIFLDTEGNLVEEFRL